jgi:hypothetical protein
LEAAKIRRTEFTTSAAEAQIRADADAADMLACQTHVEQLEQVRSGAKAACKVDSVIAVDAELLRARVAVECAAGKATSTAAEHTNAVAELRDAETAVGECARRVIVSEMVDLAGEFTAALDAAEAIGRELEALSLRDGSPAAIGTGPTLPAAVARALERLPARNPLDVPIYELRGGGMRSDRWARRLAELMADDEQPIDVDVAA